MRLIAAHALMDEGYTAREVAAFLRIHYDTLWRALRRYELVEA